MHAAAYRGSRRTRATWRRERPPRPPLLLHSPSADRIAARDSRPARSRPATRTALVWRTCAANEYSAAGAAAPAVPTPCLHAGRRADRVRMRLSSAGSALAGPRARPPADYSREPPKRKPPEGPSVLSSFLYLCWYGCSGRPGPPTGVGVGVGKGPRFWTGEVVVGKGYGGGWGCSLARPWPAGTTTPTVAPRERDARERLCVCACRGVRVRVREAHRSLVSCAAHAPTVWPLRLKNRPRGPVVVRRASAPRPAGTGPGCPIIRIPSAGPGAGSSDRVQASDAATAIRVINQMTRITES